MYKILLLIGCLLLVIVVIALPIGWFISRNRFRSLANQEVPTVCRICMGRGWVQEQERSLEFDGDGFANDPPHTYQCPTCGGTGTIFR